MPGGAVYGPSHATVPNPDKSTQILHGGTRLWNSGPFTVPPLLRHFVTSSLRHFSRVTGGIPPDLLERTPTNFDDEAIPTPGFSLTGGGWLPNIGGRRKDGE
jgi:hypothetical protein